MENESQQNNIPELIPTPPPIPEQESNPIQIMSQEESLMDRLDYVYEVLIDGASSLDNLNKVISKLEGEVFSEIFLGRYLVSDDKKVEFLKDMHKLRTPYANVMKQINQQFDIDNFIKVFGISSLYNKFKGLSNSDIKQISELLDKLKNKQVGEGSGKSE